MQSTKFILIKKNMKTIHKLIQILNDNSLKLKNFFLSLTVLIISITMYYFNPVPIKDIFEITFFTIGFILLFNKFTFNNETYKIFYIIFKK